MALKSLVPWKREDRRLGDRRGVDFPAQSLSRQIDTMFADVLGDWMGTRFFDRGLMGGFAPRVDITETEKEVKVVAEMPGLTEKDIDVQVESGTLVLRGEKRDEAQGGASGLLAI
jgi:HSP20 family protein